jgi:SsrA-binding protein
MKKKRTVTGSIANKRARFDYELKDSFMAGLVLTGPEVRSVRMNHASLQGSFVNVKDGEAWLMNAQIMPVKTNAAHLPSEMQTRNRKLLLKKRELDSLIQAKNQGLTIVPTKILTKGRFIKLEIAIARGKKQYDKRETIKRRDQDRDSARLLR